MKQLFVIISLVVLTSVALAGPLALSLGDLSPAEKANATISVDLGDSAPIRASEDARNVAELWNGGQFGLALEGLVKLEEQVGSDAMEVCINWKTPVPSPAAKWGDDVLINPRDSIFSVSLARHPASGSLFAVLSWWSGTNKGTSVNFSDNGGQTWSEVYAGTGSELYNYKTTGVVLGSYFYFAYIWNNTIRLRRNYASTGATAFFSDGSQWKTLYTATTDTIDEVKLADWSTTQLFCGSLHNRGRLNMFWTGDTGGVDWQQFNSPESTARRGLDMHGNLPYVNYYLFLSYYTNANQIRILGLGPGLNWDTIRTYSVSPNTYFTAIGAYQDTVFAAFEDTTAGGYDGVRYRVSYNGGTTWATGVISSADTHAYCPDIAMRGGGGTGVVYFQTPSYRFKWRPNAGTWTTYLGISDVTPTLVCQPSVEYLGSGYYGVAYVSNDVVDMGRAYFDRSDWTGVEGGPQRQLADQGLELETNRPNPFSRGTAISYQLPAPGRIGLRVYNAAGQLVRTLVDGPQAAGRHSIKWDGRDERGSEVSSGVYLYRLEAGGEAVTGRMTVIR